MYYIWTSYPAIRQLVIKKNFEIFHVSIIQSLYISIAYSLSLYVYSCQPRSIPPVMFCYTRTCSIWHSHDMYWSHQKISVCFFQYTFNYVTSSIQLTMKSSARRFSFLSSSDIQHMVSKLSLQNIHVLCAHQLIKSLCTFNGSFVYV